MLSMAGAAPLTIRCERNYAVRRMLMVPPLLLAVCAAAHAQPASPADRLAGLAARISGFSRGTPFDDTATRASVQYRDAQGSVATLHLADAGPIGPRARDVLDLQMLAAMTEVRATGQRAGLVPQGEQRASIAGMYCVLMLSRGPDDASSQTGICVQMDGARVLQLRFAAPPKTQQGLDTLMAPFANGLQSALR